MSYSDIELANKNLDSNDRISIPKNPARESSTRIAIRNLAARVSNTNILENLAPPTNTDHDVREVQLDPKVDLASILISLPDVPKFRSESKIIIPSGRGPSEVNMVINMPKGDRGSSQNVLSAPKASTAAQQEEKKRDFGLGDKEWHLMAESDLFKELHTTRNGLSIEEHQKRLEKYGPNVITPPPSKHWLVKLFEMLTGGFQLMMWFGSVLCFIVYGISGGTDVQTLALAIVLILVVLITSAFQFYQDGKSDAVMAALKALSPSTVFVMRAGQLENVAADSLVPGDIVKVTAGEKVPADIRILQSSDLKINNASLTGENVDIKLGADALHKELYEAKNVARSGCNFTSGSGLGVVFTTGDSTFFGQIAKATTQIEHPETLMKKEIHRLIKYMAVVAFSLGITFFILALFNGYSWVDAIVFMIGIIVANVPEGLLPQLTVALTLTAQRMLTKGVLVNNLEIIETLGAVTVICSDKTGTLTCNRMSVSHVAYDNKITITPISPHLDGDTFELFNAEDTHMKALQRIASLNTDASFLTFEPDVLARKTKGDASESAIIKFVEPLKPVANYRNECPRLCAIPFNSSNKWMLSINEIPAERSTSDSTQTKVMLFMKGAPERVMNMCSKVLINGVEVEFDAKRREQYEGINETLGKRGERVLAFAHMELSRKDFPTGFKFDAEREEGPNFPTTGLTLVGLISLIDPPRMSVKPAIAQCNTAGIRVFMVTGDHPVTAHAIAKSLNLITGPTESELLKEKLPVPEGGCKAIVVTGTEMQNFTEANWDHVLKHEEIVFARTMPQQKQDIVRELNKLGHIVAMTGDGVNDAPALKASNVGIAMGSGAAVAKEAAHIVLLTDDFGNIVDGIREGRLIFENLKKCISYVLSSNIPEIIPFLLFIGMKIPLAIETIVILTIDLGTDLAPAICLAYEESEEAIMQVPPRKPTDHLVGAQLMLVAYGTIGMFETVGAFFAFYMVFKHYGFSYNDLLGAGIEWDVPYSEMDSSRQDYFDDLCAENSYYLSHYPTDNCQGDFFDFRRDVVKEARSAFLMAVVWAQVANVFVRKTQVAPCLTWSRIFDNVNMLYSIVAEFVIIIGLIYIPGLNDMFGLAPLTGKFYFISCWILPFIILWDEIRKYLIRLNPTGFVAQATKF